MIGTIKIAELLANQWPWPKWAKVWIGFWLCIVFFCAVLACQQWWAKRKAIKSERSWHLRFSRLTDGQDCESQESSRSESGCVNGG
jgi:hypothetical protein